MVKYLQNGYIDMEHIILHSRTPFIFMNGGRGTGKTYGALRCSILYNMKMLYLRRTQVQVDIIKTVEMNPFKALNAKENFDIYPFKLTKYNSILAHGYYDDENKLKMKLNGEIGYTAALSTFASLRGADFTDVDIIIYDEFIPEETANAIRGEYMALMNLYETVNRNREVEGRKPCILLCMSNSTNAANAIYMGAKITTLAYEMSAKGISEKVDEKRGYTLYVLPETEIGTKKRETALYKFAGKSYIEHSIENKFTRDCPAPVSSRSLSGYNPLVTIGELTIYYSKDKTKLYVTNHCSGSAPKFECVGNDLFVFRRNYDRRLFRYMVRNLVEYEKYEYEILLKEYLAFTIM